MTKQNAETIWQELKETNEQIATLRQRATMLRSTLATLAGYEEGATATVEVGEEKLKIRRNVTRSFDTDLLMKVNPKIPIDVMNRCVRIKYEPVAREITRLAVQEPAIYRTLEQAIVTKPGSISVTVW